MVEPQIVVLDVAGSSPVGHPIFTLSTTVPKLLPSPPMGNGTDSKLKKLYTGISEFLTEKWVATHEEAKASRLHRFAHFWLLVFKNFSRNRCPLRATALAYTTLLALIPLLAIGFSVASSVLKEKDEKATKKFIGEFLDTLVPQLKLLSHAPAAQAETLDATTAPGTGTTSASGPPPARTPSAKSSPRDQAVNQVYELINNAQSATFGLTGMAGLIVVAILLLSTIEDTFNDIWGVLCRRNWFRRIVQYWTTISLGPILVFVIVAQVGSAFSPAAKSFGPFAFSAQLLSVFVLI